MPISPYMRALRAKIGQDLILQPGVAGVIINADGQVLLQLRSDDRTWGLPGGAMEPGEEPAETLVREIREETALEVVPERIVGVYGGPDFRVRYANGDEAAILSITFACRPVAGEPRVNDDESLEVRYFAPDALPAMPARHRMRIQDALRNDSRARFR
jgi:8-oxo-dGTP pyrophosphatase MutT (NUDIX family)